MKGYYLYPDIRGNLIAFTSDDDVWLMSLDDMKPIRITSGQGVAIRPKISPDGKRVAYTLIWLKSGKGGGDVFVTGNGETKRVTFFGSTNTRVVGWLSDEEILVITDFHTPFPQWTEAYKVNVNDGTVEKLPYGLLSNIAISENIVIIARGYQDLPFWKGYKGGTKGEFWISYDGGKTFSKFLSLDGIVSWPMIIKDRVYFLSDHEGIANLYSVNFEGKDLKKHTNFTEYYCRNASSDGRRIVFQNGGDIYLYDPEKQELRLLDIDLPTDRRKRQGKFVNVFEYLTEAVANDKYLGIVTRGKVFLMRHWEGPAVQLGEKQGVRYKQIQLLPNGDVVIVDVNDDKLTFLSKDGAVKKINADLGRIERIKVSPDGKKILISNNRMELWLYDVENDNLKLIDKSEYNVIYDMDWHPNSEWFAYTFPESFNTQSIKLAHISGKVVRVTSPYGYDFSPSFDPDGRYLYFLSARHLDPTNDKVIFNMSFQRVIKPYLVVLSNVYSPFNQPLEEVQGDSKNIELEGIEDRVVPFPVDEDYYVRIEGAKNNKVFLFSLPIKGNRYPGDVFGKLEVYDLDNKTKETYAENVKSFSLTTDKGKVLLVFKDSMRLLDVNAKLDPNATGKKGGVIDLSRVKVYVEPEKEWRQMLREAWKLMKQNYWKADGLTNWDSVLSKYEKLIDRISTRFELSDLIQEMQGETRTSHSYEMPYDYETPEPLIAGGLGAEFEYDKENKCYRITKIYVGDPTNENERSPLRDPGVQLNVGDCIKAVDGEEVKNNIYSYFVNKDQVVLDVITHDNKTKRVTVKLLKDEKFLMYRHWVERNREYVHEKSKGRLGYVHIPDMMYQGFAEFYRLFLSEFYRDGLIVDVRFNRGGFISGLILEKLLLKRMGYVVRRNGKEIPEPYFSSPSVIVAITNQYAGSDGDIFSYLFKKYKLGVLIGRRTWGGVIGISIRDRLADKSAVSQPEFAVHFYDIGLKVENYGVDPDIEVDIKPEDYANGKDTQLDTAIEIALKQLEKKD